MTVAKGRKCIVYFLCALLVLGQGAVFDVSSADIGEGVYWFLPLTRLERISGVNPGMSKAPLPQCRFIAEAPSPASGGEERSDHNNAFRMTGGDVLCRTSPPGDINVVPFISEENCFYLII